MHCSICITPKYPASALRYSNQFGMVEISVHGNLLPSHNRSIDESHWSSLICRMIIFMQIRTPASAFQSFLFLLPSLSLHISETTSNQPQMVQVNCYLYLRFHFYFWTGQTTQCFSAIYVRMHITHRRTSGPLMVIFIHRFMARMSEKPCMFLFSSSKNDHSVRFLKDHALVRAEYYLTSIFSATCLGVCFERF